MLIYFEPASMCNMRKDLVVAPLPARKQLWEATDAVSWQAETDCRPDTQSSFGLASNGELVELDEWQLPNSVASMPLPLAKSSAADTSSNNSKNWEEWCSGMDGFGALVTLAASFVV